MDTLTRCMKSHALMVAAFCMLPLTLSASATDSPIQLETKAVALSEKIKIGDRVGKLRFLGMLELPDITQNGLRLSQLSGLAWDEDDGVLYAISDIGGLFHLHPEFQKGALVGLKLLKAMPLRELAGL